jgi:5'-3' exonuclease
MGIPAYFSHVLRRHKGIVLPFDKALVVAALYIDSNSVVYDAVHALEYQPAGFEERLIAEVCRRLLELVESTKAARVFVAFDGVPPMAKMKQQRERRYKSAPSAGWNTVQITPGTTFMRALDAGVKAFFADTTIQVSGSDEPGEGEHKIYQLVRDAPVQGLTLIYGLDSDLIMLSLNHLKYGEIKLLREAPEFKRQEQGMCMLDVPALAAEIKATFGSVEDYILVAMLLGNDFMPRFPALNLRTNGMRILTETYAKTNVKLCDGGDIVWPHLALFLKALGEREQSDLRQEYTLRERKTVEDTPENMPMRRRELERYINPLETGWQGRYYRTLFQSEAQSAPAFCQNYLEMLQWTLKYYCGPCTNWGLYYKPMYAPLLEDLCKHVLTFKEDKGPDKGPVDAVDLLKFVLPAELAGFSVRPYVPEKKHPHLYWTFFTFDWEAKLLF